MARLLPEAFASAIDIESPRRATAGAALRIAATVGIAAGLLLGIALMLAFAGPVHQAPDLALLIRAMVAIKGLMLAVAAAAVLWRLGRPAPAPFVVGYTLALGLSAAALGWLWGLSLIPLGSALFYGGLIAAFIIANRDDGFFEGVLPSRHR